jgi:hypothetical protein
MQIPERISTHSKVIVKDPQFDQHGMVLPRLVVEGLGRAGAAPGVSGRVLHGDGLCVG